MIDPLGWMSAWNGRFATLDIQSLRSPTIAHPDAFDNSSLLGFAQRTGRTAELRDDSAKFWGSNLRGQRELSSGLFTIPSSKLFTDFCMDLASRLPHSFVKAKVIDIEECDDAAEQLWVLSASAAG